MEKLPAFARAGADVGSYHHQRQLASIYDGYQPADYLASRNAVASAPRVVRIGGPLGPGVTRTALPPAAPEPVGRFGSINADDSRSLGSVQLNATTSLAPSRSGHSSTATHRCSKCGAYYRADEDGVCCYHPGRYSSPESPGAFVSPATMLMRWSCCKGFDQAAPGCRQHDSHTPDTSTAAILSNFGRSLSYQQELNASVDVATEDNGHHRQDENAPLEADEDLMEGMKRTDLTTKNASSERQGAGTMVWHTVSMTDTIVGIALRYGVKVDDIQHANNITSHSIFAHKHLLVPNPARIPSPEELHTAPPKDGRRNIALDRFVALTRCSKKEAEYYLSENDFDITKAITAYEEDLKWEKSAPQPKKA